MKRILLLLPEGFEFLEAAAFIDVFGWNMLAGDKTTELFCAGAMPIIQSSFDHSIHADILLDQINTADFAALALPGGFARFGYFAAQDNAQIKSIIQAFAAQNKPLAAVCTGALILGSCGILTDKHATTYQGEDSRWLKQLAGYGAIVVEENHCVDGNIITSSDPASAPFVALELLGILTSRDNSQTIKKMMGY